MTLAGEIRAWGTGCKSGDKPPDLWRETL